MLQAIIRKNFLCSNFCNLDYSKEKKLDVRKLKLLLHKLGFSPVSAGTTYILEELEYFYNNNILEIKNLNDAYNISAKIHKLNIKHIQWNVESSILVMNRFADSNLLKEIFYWYDNYKNITPKYFLSTMLEFLNEHSEEYKL